MSPHLVDRHIFDIHYNNEAKAVALQDKISFLSNNKLFEAIATVFDEFESAETVRFETLELDIGKISEANLEYELLFAIQESLRKTLSKSLREKSASTISDHLGVTENEDREILILERFIRTGTLPWWVRHEGGIDIKTLIDSVFKNNLDALIRMIRSNAEKQAFLGRLVINLNWDQLSDVIHQLDPVEAKAVIDAGNKFIQAHEVKRVAQTDTREYRNKVWEFVLTYLLIDRGSVFNQKVFIQSVIERLSRHFNVNYDTFLEHFYGSIKSLSKHVMIPHGLTEIIREIYEEKEVTGIGKKIPKTTSTKTSIYTLLVTKNAALDLKSRESLAKLIKSQSEEFKIFLLREGKKGPLTNNLSKVLSDSLMYQLIELIEPEGKTVIVNFSDNLQKVKESGKIQLNVSNEKFRETKWEFILKALLVDRGSRFNLKSFVKAALSGLTKQFGLDYHDLVHYVLSRLDTGYTSTAQGELSTVLLEIKNEEEVRINKESQAERKQFEEKIRFQWIEYTLEHSAFPGWQKKHKLRKSDFQSILFDLISSTPTAVRTLLYAELKSNRKRFFLLKQLNEKGRKSIVHFINPKVAEKVELYSALLDKVREKEKISGSQQEFSTLKWNAVLEVLTTDKGSFFNFKTFILRSLHQLSHHFNISFSILFSHVTELSDSIPESQQNELKRAIHEIQSELNEDLSEKNDSTVLSKEAEKLWKGIGSDDQELKQLFAILFRMKNDYYYRSHMDLSRWLYQNTKVQRHKIAQLIHTLGLLPEELVRMFGQQKEDARKKLLKLVSDNETRFLFYYMDDMRKLLLSFDRSQVLIREMELFSVSYFMYTENADKHLFFKKLNEYLSDFYGIRSDKMAERLEETIKTGTTQLNSTLALSISKTLSHTAPVEGKKQKQEEEIQKEEIREETEEQPEDDENTEGIYITNAGLVLLWPFLAQYFKMLELTEENKFKSIAESIRAVHLLQFICTGEEEHPEHELALNKILCGLPLSIPIDNRFEIAPKEKELTDSMLNGVLQNWSRMGDSSVEALRETFLNRHGIIEFTDDTIDLRVEKKTVDILLDSMPWSFTIVNFPWMKKPIRTVWN